LNWYFYSDSSVNKNKNKYDFFLHTQFLLYIFYIFYLFIFLFFIFGLGWAKSSLAYILVAGLSSAPQGLGQPGPVTCPSH
jgi:hypothetical protein